jgi:hypothetical protein
MVKLWSRTNYDYCVGTVLYSAYLGLARSGTARGAAAPQLLPHAYHFLIATEAMILRGNVDRTSPATFSVGNEFGDCGGLP